MACVNTFNRTRIMVIIALNSYFNRGTLKKQIAVCALFVV